MTLQALVQHRLDELGLSARGAAKRARGRISHETIAVILQGRHSGRITDKTAEALAIALDVPISKVYEAASATQPTSRWDWPQRLDRLPLSQRRLVEDFAAALLAAYDRGVRDGRASRDMTPLDDHAEPDGTAAKFLDVHQ